MFIDPHVHCRDGKQAYKETIAHALSVAEHAGLTALFDMPNTDPPITRRKQVFERLALARKANSSVWYGLHIALTADAEQIKEAVQTYREFAEVVGLKLYAGHSVGNTGVITKDKQQRIYSTLSELGYEGVVAVHCEKEELLRPKLWDPKKPITHAYARPAAAEIESVRDQLELAADAKFMGKLHIAHISVPEAVDLVAEAKRKLRVSCGVTPHHILFDSTRMEHPDGLLYKVNPPLRSHAMAFKLLLYLKQGKIDWIESDHAPHSLEEKLGKPYLSGLPGLPFYPHFIAWLRSAGFTDEQLRKITFENIRQSYGIELKPREAVPDLELASDYPFDPFKELRS